MSGNLQAYNTPVNPDRANLPDSARVCAREFLGRVLEVGRAHDVVAVEHIAGSVAGDGHGHALGDARIDQVSAAQSRQSPSRRDRPTRPGCPHSRPPMVPSPIPLAFRRQGATPRRWTVARLPQAHGDLSRRSRRRDSFTAPAPRPQRARPAIAEGSHAEGESRLSRRQARSKAARARPTPTGEFDAIPSRECLRRRVCGGRSAQCYGVYRRHAACNPINAVRRRNRWNSRGASAPKLCFPVAANRDGVSAQATLREVQPDVNRAELLVSLVAGALDLALPFERGIGHRESTLRLHGWFNGGERGARVGTRKSRDGSARTGAATAMASTGASSTSQRVGLRMLNGLGRTVSSIASVLSIGPTYGAVRARRAADA